MGIDFNDDLTKIEAADKVLKNADFYGEIEVSQARLQVAIGKANLYTAISKTYENPDFGQGLLLPNATLKTNQIRAVPEGHSAGDNNSFIHDVLQLISTHNGSGLIHYTVDERVNYFGDVRMRNALIEHDVNGTAHPLHASKPLEIAHAYLFDKPILNTKKFTHEISNEYSEHWVGPMLYDSLDVQTQTGWARFTVGYTVVEDRTAIYALVLKIQ